MSADPSANSDLEHLQARLAASEAELAVINSIQQGLAAELDFQSIIDLVGNQIQEVLGVQDIGIRWHDKSTDQIHFLYEFERGKRLDLPPQHVSESGVLKALNETQGPLFFNSQKSIEDYGINTVPGTETSQSGIYVPIQRGNEVMGMIGVESLDDPNAFDESDVRLLTTIGNAMGVALHNAELFEEIQEQNAELAVINSIQQGLAASIDFQGIADLVGDKLREVLKTENLVIWWHNKSTNHIHHIDLLDICTRHLNLHDSMNSMEFEFPSSDSFSHQKLCTTSALTRPPLVILPLKYSWANVGKCSVIVGANSKSNSTK